MKSKETTSTSTELELKPEALRWYCPPEMIPASTTEGVEPIEGIIGQDRALKALKLGVELDSPGYNIFVSGLSGTGKATTIKTILEKIQSRKNCSRDFCYVSNFENRDHPTLLQFERGKGCDFKKDMGEAVRLVLEKVPHAFQEEEYVKKRQSFIEEYHKREMDLFSEFEKEIEPDGFILGRVQQGQNILPELMVKLGDKQVMISDLSEMVEKKEMTQEQTDELVEKYKIHKRRLQKVLQRGMKVTREYRNLIHEHECEVADFFIQAIFDEVFESYEQENVRNYLKQVVAHMLENLDDFKSGQDEAEESEVDVSEYEVNVILDNSSTSDCPVIIETNPTFRNIFGTIEKRQDANGYWYTDFTQIKSGSLLEADGGFLVINAVDAMLESGVWKILQRVLLYRKHEIQSNEAASQQAASALKPEAIDIDVKVILIGNNDIYSALSMYERDFKKIFKVKADFDYEMPNTDLAVKQYAALVRKLVRDENLKHFDRHAIAGIVEYGSRLVENRNKVTTQFSAIADIVREADYWCRQNSNKYVTNVHVDKAISEVRDRHGLTEEKLQEMIEDEVILIDVSGQRIGQINGLAVYGGDRFSFGMPTRITASISAGKAGIINIEREARLSGSTHDKGVLILSGYLREKFAQEHPLALTASISFEQSYSGVDGDSASSTEMYALLSSLSGIPIRQCFAVTGSVNQKGDIQPIGGVNEKVEGFFEVCEKRGLTGDQGVLIPIQNLQDLMLRSHVVDAVKEGTFHVYAISRIEEGIEILTGVQAGEPDADRQYAGNTIFNLVRNRLDELYAVSLRREIDAE